MKGRLEVNSPLVTLTLAADIIAEECAEDEVLLCTQLVKVTISQEVAYGLNTGLVSEEKVHPRELRCGLREVSDPSSLEFAQDQAQLTLIEGAEDHASNALLIFVDMMDGNALHCCLARGLCDGVIC